jgi:hypothetical protein
MLGGRRTSIICRFRFVPYYVHQRFHVQEVGVLAEAVVHFTVMQTHLWVEYETSSGLILY